MNKQIICSEFKIFKAFYAPRNLSPYLINIVLYINDLILEFKRVYEKKHTNVNVSHAMK